MRLACSMILSAFIPTKATSFYATVGHHDEVKSLNRKAVGGPTKDIYI